MKNKSNISLAIFFGVLFLLIISSCKKDQDNDDTNQSNQFSVSIDYGNAYDYYWVILHNLDGTEIVDYKKLEGNGTVNFGVINENLVTATIVRVDSVLFSYEPFIYISTDYSVPNGNWKVSNGWGKGSLGMAGITLSFASGNYNSYLYGSSTTYLTSQNVPDNEICLAHGVAKLDFGNKFSFYGAVYSNNGGYCNWLLHQPFQLNNTNSYTLQLNKMLDLKTIVASKPINSFKLYGNMNDRNIQLLMYDWSDTNSLEELGIKYPSEMPITSFKLLGEGGDEDCKYYYSKYVNSSEGIPNNLVIPNTTLIASYDELNEEFINISINGTADKILGQWIYSLFNFNEKKFVYWNVNSNFNSTTLKRPLLPQEVIDDIGDVINLMEPSFIGTFDYNTTSNHLDIIKRFYIDDIPDNQKYDESFSYLYEFDKNKRYEFELIDNDKYLIRESDGRLMLKNK